ncbi:antirestriction protein ArdR [Salmonella enterica]|nr:antirestriction protein ArdR [Salmonella enterica]
MSLYNQLKIIEAAKKWRQEHPEHINGVVLIWKNKAYGWKDKLRNPECEQPGAYAVDIDNNVFIAEGGNDYDGAKCWVVTEN